MQFVDKYYEMNPDEDDFLFEGDELKDGMKVLIGDPRFRADVGADNGIELAPAVAEQARRYNRWCLVDRVVRDESHVAFLATYDDGVKKKIVVPIVWPWLAKRDNSFTFFADQIPAPEKYEGGLINDTNTETNVIDKKFNSAGNSPTRLYEREDFGLEPSDMLR